MFSLEELCLDLIVQTFERLYFAYTVSKDDHHKRNFNFLQRKYSRKVLHKLYESSKLKEEFLKLLINEHLNYLYDRWIRDSAYECSWNDVFLRLPNLKEIEFSRCDDAILEYLAKSCPKLVKIKFSGWCDVTDKGVEYLCKDKNGTVPFPEIKHLSIEHTNVTVRGVECIIRNLTSLERIDCKNVPLSIYSIYRNNLQEFKTVQSYNLVELSFLRSDRLPKSRSLSNRTAILKTCLTVCPKLKYLSCYITDKEQLDLLTNIHWEKLHLEFPTTGQNFNIDYFLKLKGCRVNFLSITDCTMSISAFALHSPFLKEFSAERIIFSDIDDDDDDLKVTFSSLWSCEFKNIEHSSNKAICFLLSSSPELVCLTFDNCMLSPELRKQILLWGKTPCTQFIELGGIHIASEMEYIEDILLNCPSLDYIRLRDDSWGENEIEELEIRKKLENIANSLPNKPGIYIW